MQNGIKEIDALLSRRKTAEAHDSCQTYLAAHPTDSRAHLLMARIQQQLADFDGMLTSAKTAGQHAENDTVPKLMAAEALLYLGKITDTVILLQELENGAEKDTRLLQQIAELYTQAGRIKEAYRAYERSLLNSPNDAGLLYNQATAAMGLGKLEEAEALFDKVIQLNPGDYDAYYNRATLRRWTEEHNHIAPMEALLKSGTPDHKGAIQLFYALAKEYEDIGGYTDGFAHLERGANLRAAMMRYDVRADVKAMQQIAAIMDDSLASSCPPARHEPGPIFIIGLPRTGTTLVDRILSSHSDVESLGEINDFALNVMHECAPVRDKDDLIRKTSNMDFEALGEAYLTAARERSQGGLYLIDKTPANFLYAGIIARAIPSAKIIHLTRGAMDSCFAIYKTLFRMGYPYSYRQEDLAEYYHAYQSLMTHWHQLLPGRILDISYEKLVTNLEAEVRRLLEHCSLPWQEECLAFHQNKSPSATASAAQVRQPLYNSSVGKWRHYEAQLTPLRTKLETLGISVNEDAAA